MRLQKELSHELWKTMLYKNNEICSSPLHPSWPQRSNSKIVKNSNLREKLLKTKSVDMRAIKVPISTQSNTKSKKTKSNISKAAMRKQIAIIKDELFLYS